MVGNLVFNDDAVGWMPKLIPRWLREVPPAKLVAGARREPAEPPDPPHYGFVPNAGALLGLIGILMAFGHSFLAMSGEESLAQVNRELEYPKHANLMKAGMVIFVYSLLFTSLVSFFAYALIPDDVRPQYFNNLISGISMYLAGPMPLKLLFQGFIVVVGFLMLAGAINTSIIGSNGVLEPRVGRRRDDRLVPRAAQEIRHDLPDDQPDRPAAARGDHRIARQHLHARRGVRVRRHLVVRVQGPGDAGPAVQGPVASRVEGAVQPAMSAARRFRSAWA